MHEANDAFHLTLFSACGNPYLVESIKREEEAEEFSRLSEQSAATNDIAAAVIVLAFGAGLLVGQCDHRAAGVMDHARSDAAQQGTADRPVTARSHHEQADAVVQRRVRRSAHRGDA